MRGRWHFIVSIEEKISYTFKNKDLLKEALTHKSFSGGSKYIKHNERLEFLGDSVLGALVADYIYTKCPNDEEGVLSKIKSALVSRHNLYFWGKELGLGEYMLLGSGEESTGGRTRESILSNAVEALLGAVYLDGGFSAVKAVCGPWLARQVLQSESGDHKSALQEYFQKKGKPPPVYDVEQTVGPEHDKIFTVSVSIQGKELARGKGKNKKLAEQAAAQAALTSLK